jgi:hypothetical protein
MCFMHRSFAKIFALLFFLSAAASLAAETALPVNAEKIAASEFEDLKKKAVNLQEISSADGILTVWDADQCPPKESSCERYPANLLVKAGKTGPVFFKVPFELLQNGRSGVGPLDDKTPDKQISSIKPGSYFFFFYSGSYGMHGGENYVYPIFYNSSTKSLKIGEGIVTSYGSDMTNSVEENLKLQLKDLNGDGIKEIIINKTQRESGCREGKCRRIEDCPEQTPCPYSSNSEWVAGIWDYKGKDLMKSFGYGACWDYRALEGKKPDAEFWGKVDPYRFARKEFVTWQPEKWQGPKDLSFEVRIAKEGNADSDNYFQPTYLDITVHDDVVIADPSLPEIQRDHLELWFPASNINYQFGVLPPEAASTRAKIVVWKTCTGSCARDVDKWKTPIGPEKITVDWQATPDGYRVELKLPPEISALGICVSDNDSLTAPEQKTMMCTSKPASGSKDVAHKDRCNSEGD